MQEKDHTNSPKLIEVSIESIEVDPTQPRQVDSFKQETLESLAQSIQQVGLLSPPIVKEVSLGQYQIIAGERRYRASQIAGLKKIPVLLQNKTSLESALSALTENLQREDLNPIDYASALQRLMQQFGLSQQKLAEQLGLNRASLSNHIRILSLPQDIQKALKKELISLGHAKALLAIKDSDKQLIVFQKIIRDHLSVRQVEALTIEEKTPSSSLQKKPPSILIRQIQEKLQEKFGTKVSFSGNEKAGSLSFHYYNLSDLNRLLNELGYSED